MPGRMKTAKKNKLISDPPKEFPFVVDPSHIYNTLSDEGLGEVDMGVYKFVFELCGKLEDDEQKCDGVTDFSKQTIKLEAFLPDLQARETIIHEIMHCMLENLGLHEANFDQKSISITNEALVYSLAKQFILFYNLNPKFMAALFNEK